MPAHHYPFIDLAVHAAVRDHFAKGDAVAVLSRDLGEVLWANGAAAHLFGFSNIYDALDEGFGGQPATRRQIESAVSGLGRTGKPQNFMMRVNSGFSRSMAPATLDAFTLPDGAPALLLTSSQAGQVLAPGARARQIIAGFEGTGTHVAVLDKDGQVLAASSTFGEIGLAGSDIDRMVADVTGAGDRLVKRMTASPIGAMPTAIGRLADDPALHLLFAVEPAPVEEPAPEPLGETTTVIADAYADASEDEAIDQPQDEATETTSFAADDEAHTPAAPANEEAPADASEVVETVGVKAEDPATSNDGGRRITFFDTRRIRDELNARLAKAERENALPAPFEEASGLVLPTPPEDTSSDTPAEDKTVEDEAAEETGVKDAAPESATEGENALIAKEDTSDRSEVTIDDAGSSELEATQAEDAASERTTRDEDAGTAEQDVPDLAEETAADAAGSDFEDTASEQAEAEDTSSGEQVLSAEQDETDEADAAGEFDENTDTGIAGPESDAPGEDAASAQHETLETVDTSAEGEDNEQLEAPVAETAEPEDTTLSDEAVTAEQHGDADGDIPSAARDGDSDSETPVDVSAAAAPQFRFDPEGKPARFVWKINKDGEFSEVSPEFAAAVGPHSADIIGRKFPDLARVFNLDPDHVITDLLNRRDTWSGKTVLWPIQGTELVTPVDLAALPTYTRDRRFDGFRGFGIVRTGEAKKDPEALGLALVPGSVLRSVARPPEAEDHADEAEALSQELAAPDQPDEIDRAAQEDADLEARTLESDIEDLARMDGVEADSSSDDAGSNEAGTDDAETAASGAPAVDDSDPFRGERPAIRLVETPMRRDSDKVIDLETRRPRLPKDGLSPGEQAAFREIGVRLTSAPTPDQDQPAAPPAAEKAPEQKPESEAPALPQDQQTFGKRQASENDGQAGIDAPQDAGETGSSPDEDAADITDEQDEIAAEAATPDAAVADSEDDAPSTQDDAAVGPLPIPSAFALPTRQAMPAGMNAGIIDAIPAALLIHSGDRLIHGNSEFFELTGYASLEELSERGGLDHLLERPTDDEASGDTGLFVRRGDGTRHEITARLRSVNWGDSQALLLALSPRESLRAPVAAVVPDSPPMEDDAAGEAEAAAHDHALEIEAQELRSILETATDGVVILNNDGSIRSMNGSACALFNYDENETHDEPFAMLFAHESQRAVMDYVSGLAEHGVSSVLNDGREVIGREASGGFLPLFMTIGRLTGSNGYCAVLRDITNWKRTEEELRTAKRAAETANAHKSDFLARVSHEVRTPLNAIIGFSEMMVEERFGPIGSPRYLEYAHDIGNSGKHVLDIVNDLLDISKIEAGQVSMEFVSVSLNDHLAETVSLLQPMANSQRVIIRTSLSASVPEVVADQRSIKQIALNLLSNAIRYTPSGGQIVVSTSYEPSGNVVIRIRDTGIGMNRKELEQAMKPFGQVGPGPRQRGDGTGLGLPLTKAMVEANRAQFDIVSAPGEGTLVSIAFPPQRVLAD